MEAAGVKRGITFIKSETAFLVELVSEFKDLIESRSTDGTTNRLKSETWSIIEDRFNVKELGTVRSAHQLKLKYVDIKRQLRKKVADYKRQFVKAVENGTKKPSLLLNTEESIVYSWLHPTTMGLHDVDAVTFEIVEDSEHCVLEDNSSSHSMLSDFEESEIAIDELKMESADESFTTFPHELDSPLKKRKITNNDEKEILEFYKRKESKEDKEHKLLVHKYEMEVAILQNKLKESECDRKKMSRFEKEMMAYYKRKEVKEDIEHKLLIQKYELEIALLHKNLT